LDIRKYVLEKLTSIGHGWADVLVRTHSTSNEKLEESQLQTAMEKSKIKVSQGCIDLLQVYIWKHKKVTTHFHQKDVE
jgi:hypothetical protein